MPGVGPYAATKAAIEVLSNTLAQELGSRGITVNALHPGPVDTDMMRNYTAGNPGVAAYMTNISPMKRMVC
jgi:3-oxoacyl-[acyl-carrier protein] reductase